MDNQYGLDYKYFERWVEGILNSGGFKNYRPRECARVFARMSRAADEAVLLEPEFTSALHERLQTAEAERDALKAECDILKAERDELLSALKMARQDIENTRNVFLTYSLDQKFYDNMATYDNLISKYGEKDNDN